MSHGGHASSAAASRFVRECDPGRRWESGVLPSGNGVTDELATARKARLAEMSRFDHFPDNGTMPENTYHQVPYPNRSDGADSSRPSGVGGETVRHDACSGQRLPGSRNRLRRRGNLIPMAYRLAGSHFTGIDLAEKAVEERPRSVAELPSQISI